MSDATDCKANETLLEWGTGGSAALPVYYVVEGGASAPNLPVPVPFADANNGVVLEDFSLTCEPGDVAIDINSLNLYEITDFVLGEVVHSELASPVGQSSVVPNLTDSLTPPTGAFALFLSAETSYQTDVYLNGSSTSGEFKVIAENFVRLTCSDLTP